MMKAIRRRNLNCFLICLKFNNLIYVTSDSVKCESNSSLDCDANITENLINESHHDNIEERNRRNRAIKPATQFFDELLGERLFNTTMNFIVPGAKVHLPRHVEDGSVDHLAMQAFFGIFWAIAWIATIAFPVSHTYFQPLGIGRSFAGKNGLHLDKKLADVIGLDWRSCLKKPICQAHEFPGKYGVLGKTVQILFPADDKLGDAKIYDTTTFHDASLNGAIGQDCSHIYKCFFDILDVILYVKKYCFASLSDSV